MAGSYGEGCLGEEGKGGTQKVKFMQGDILNDKLPWVSAVSTPHHKHILCFRSISSSQHVQWHQMRSQYIWPEQRGRINALIFPFHCKYSLSAKSNISHIQHGIITKQALLTFWSQTVLFLINIWRVSSFVITHYWLNDKAWSQMLNPIA